MLKFVTKHVRKLSGDLSDCFYWWQIRKIPDGNYFTGNEIPSFTQWESKNLIDKIIKGKMDTKNDPLWGESWAQSPEEYETYSWQICGMACLKMILKSVNKEKDYKLIGLAKDAEKYWVYKRNNNPDPKVNLDGLFHKKFLSFIRTFWLKWKLKSWTKEHYISHLLMRNYFIIASVHPSIREESIISNSKTWHLVLLVGFRIRNWKIQGFFINNPSGYFEKSQQKHFVNIANWRKVFSGNIDVIEINA